MDQNQMKTASFQEHVDKDYLKKNDKPGFMEEEGYSSCCKSI